MLCNVNPKKFQYSWSALSNIVKFIQYIVKYCKESPNIVRYCRISTNIVDIVIFFPILSD